MEELSRASKTVPEHRNVTLQNKNRTHLVRPSRQVLRSPVQLPEFRWVRDRMRTGDGYLRFQTYTSPYMWLPLPPFVIGRHVVSDILMKRSEAIDLAGVICNRGLALERQSVGYDVTSADVYSRNDVCNLFSARRENYIYIWSEPDHCTAYTHPFIKPVYDCMLAPWLMYCLMPLAPDGINMDVNNLWTGRWKATAQPIPGRPPVAYGSTSSAWTWYMCARAGTTASASWRMSTCELHASVG